MNDPARWVLGAAIAFLVGSIPFGFILGKLRGVDIRAHGSGNIGATNVLRVFGWRLGALCFALDVLKGALPVALIGAWLGVLGEESTTASRAWGWWGIAGAAVAGHMFCPWIGFKGGKGVATGFGAILGMWPTMTFAALLALVVFGSSLKLTRYVGISSCFAALSLPIGVALLRFLGVGADVEVIGRGGAVASAWPHVAATTLLGAVVIWKHRANIARTLAGTEHRIGERIKTAGTAEEGR